MATGGIFLNGSSQYLEYSGRIVSGFPFSMAIWVTKSADQYQAWLSQSQLLADRQVSMWQDVNGTSRYATVRNPGNGASATKTTAPYAGATLQLVVGVFTSTTSRTLYFGDNTGVTDTNSITDDISNHDTVTIGAWHTNSTAPSLFMAGVVAEAHFFDAALSSSDVTTLLTTAPDGGGIASWVDGWKLASNSDLTSIGGTRTLTAVGSPSTGSVTLPYTRTGGGSSIGAGLTSSPLLSGRLLRGLVR